ncbi:MAG: hypothetical protein ACM3MI_00430 [Clostridiales bacterium]
MDFPALAAVGSRVNFAFGCCGPYVVLCGHGQVDKATGGRIKYLFPGFSAVRG